MAHLSEIRQEVLLANLRISKHGARRIDNWHRNAPIESSNNNTEFCIPPSYEEARRGGKHGVGTTRTYNFNSSSCASRRMDDARASFVTSRGVSVDASNIRALQSLNRTTDRLFDLAVHSNTNSLSLHCTTNSAAGGVAIAPGQANYNNVMDGRGYVARNGEMGQLALPIDNTVSSGGGDGTYRTHRSKGCLKGPPRRNSTLAKIVRVLEDRRIFDDKDLVQLQDIQYPVLRTILNIIFVGVGASLFMAVIVVIIYTTMAEDYHKKADLVGHKDKI